MFNKLKQFKEIRDQAKNIHSALAGESAVGQDGGVTITMNGNQEVTKVEIDPSLLNSDAKSKLESNITQATNKAIKNVQKIMAEKMKSMGNFDFSKMLGE
ncbi:YbaB/EbfC family nucleoid-associated protein [Candidatus Falkowbacteria bacterium]|nr:YbaB/EbfC family nucleoid-associated protein [Candidatus Falkowbacteria bacterium]